MQPRKILPHRRSSLGRDMLRRSISGASTASNDSSATQDSAYEAAERRYAPIRPHTQHTFQPPVIDSRQSSPEHEFTPEDAALEHVHRFNSGYAPTYDPQLSNSQEPQQFSPMVEAMQQDYMSGSEAPASAIPVPPGRETNNSTPAPEQGGTDAERPGKKNASATAANEKELRELLEKNEHKALDAIARDVRQAERTQKSERAKQLFAMRWLREFCKQDKESVPRSRVYTHYAQRCGTDRVDTLNPASFGKLVRIIFPGIQTRRLGVRGESKYHYVNLALREDPQAVVGRPNSAIATSGLFDGAGYDQPSDFNYSSTLRADTAAFPVSDQDASFQSQVVESNPQSKGLLFADPQSLGFRPDGESPEMVTQSLRFSASVETALQDEPLTLPSIQAFVPPKTDPEIAEALTALYRTHCTSLIDSVRYVKEKQFFRLLGAFNGTLTVPVLKLFSHQSVALWIKLCDWMMYQQIVRFVSQLALQVIPPQVFTMLGNVASNLANTLRKNFSHHPEHVLAAKMEPATIFASLLSRLLRVNETAHAAANLLTNDDVRNLMWQDWVKSVQPKRVVETELPQCGHEEVYMIITQDIRRLLEPLAPSDWFEAGTQFQTDVFSPSRQLGFADTNATTAEGILDRWTVFLKSLPGRFPRVQTRTLLHCLSAVGTATLRDITVNQCQSFGSWWITKVWVDEMMLWLAEMGGFLDSRPNNSSETQNTQDDPTNFVDADHGSLRNSVEPANSAGLGIDFQQMPQFAPINHGRSQSMGPPTATFKFGPRVMHKREQLSFDMHDHNEDSGIGMELLDDSMHDFGTAAGLHNGHMMVH